MPLPPGTRAFPTATPGIAPAAPAPTYSLTQEGRLDGALLPNLYGPPTPTANVPTGPIMQSRSALFLSQATNGAVDSDPRAWTPADAQMQTDRALSRIAVANPALAQELAAQQGQLEDGGEDKGFFGTLLGGVGSVLEFTHLDDVFEFISRPAKLLPEVIMDWGEESVWKNAGDALSGHSDVSWDDVLVEKLGMERNWFTAAVGFVGDVALDPLTYTTFGLGGVARKTAAMTLSKAAISGGLQTFEEVGQSAVMRLAAPMAEEVAQKTGMSIADATAEVVMNTMRKQGMGELAAKSNTLLRDIGTKVGMVHDDAISGVLNTVDNKLARFELEELVSVADSAFRAGYRGNWRKMSAEAAAKMGLDKSAIDASLKGIVSRGTGFAPLGTGGYRATKAAYAESKAAGAALGGMRFQLGIPVLGLRLAPRSILPRWVPQMSFGPGRRFFGGIAGEVRLEKMIGKGATVDDLKLFWEGGFDLLRRESPDVAAKLGGGSVVGRIGSPLLSASQQVGRLTEHLAPHAKNLRMGGLGSHLAAESATIAKQARNQLADTMMSVPAADGTARGSAETSRFIDNALGFKNLDAPGQTELVRDLDEYIRLTPASIGYAGVEAGYDAAGGLLSPQVLADKARAIALEAKLTASGKLEAANTLRKVVHKRDELMLQHGMTPHGYESTFDQMDALRPQDADRAAAEAAPHLRGVQYEFVDEADNAAENFRDGILRDRAGDGTPIRGAQVRKVEEGGYAVTGSTQSIATAERALRRAKDKLQVAAKRQEDVEPLLRAYEEADAALRELTQPKRRLVVYAKNGLTRDLRRNVENLETKVTPGSPLDEISVIQEEIGRAKELMGEKLDEALEGADPEIARIVKEIVETGDGATSETMTRYLQQQGFDHVRTITDEGEFITILRSADGSIPVARIEPNAPWALRGRGSTLRGLTDDVRRVVHKSKAHRDLPGGSEAWLEQEMRKVAHLPYDEAEVALRQALRAEGLDISPNQRILEADPFKMLDANVREASASITNRLLGKSARAIESLGLAKTVQNGELVGVNKFKYVLNPTIFKDLESLGTGHYKSVERLAALQADKLPELQRVASEASEALKAHYARLDDVTSALDPSDLSVRVNSILDEVDNPLQRDFEERLRSDRMEQLSPDSYRYVDDDGTITYYHVDPVAPEVPEGMRLFYHETDTANVPSIMKEGVRKSKFSRGGEGFFAFANRGGVVPEGRSLVAWYGDPARVAEQATNGALTVRGIGEPENIVKVYKSGERASATLRGARSVKTNGQVDMMVAPSAELEGIEAALTRQHWTDEGVYAAEDQFEAAATVMSRGASGGDTRLLVRLSESTKDRLARNADAATRQLEGENIAIAGGLDEVNRLSARMTTEAAAVKPAFFEAGPATERAIGMGGLERLDIPGFETLAMPTFMAQEFKVAMRGFNRIDGPHLALRKFNAWWKSHATYMWPGFHIRNMYGGFFNNMLGGVGMEDYVMAGRIQRAATELDGKVTKGRWSSRKLISGSDKDIVDRLRRSGETQYYGVPIEELTYGDLARSMQGDGIFASNGRAFAEARLGVSEVESATQGRRFSERAAGLKQYTGIMKRAGTLTENTLRGAAFSRGLRDYGNAMEARISTMMRHGDYADLTDFEYNIVRDVIPFYKWMRTNVPFQVHQLLENPGKLLAVQKAQGAVFTGMGLDYDEERYRMPAWMSRSFVIPFNVREEDGEAVFNTVMADLPMSDLHMSAREFVSSAMPLMRPFMENYIYEQSTFTGAPITGKKIPLAGVFNVPGIRDILSATGLADKGPDGQLYTTDKNQNLIGVLPMFSRFRDWLYADPNRVKNRMNSFASAAFGATLRSVDADALTSAEMDFYYSQVLPAMNHLREMGYTLPTTSDVEAAFGSTTTALQRLGIEPSTTTQTSTAA